MRCAGHVARKGEDSKVYKVLVGKPEGKRPLGRPRRRWEDGIRMNIREIGLGGCGLDSTGSGQGPVASCCECGDEPSCSCVTELVSVTDLGAGTSFPRGLSLSFTVALGGLVVTVLATGPKVHELKPDKGRWILKDFKNP
jgi:hypothetical protein